MVARGKYNILNISLAALTAIVCGLFVFAPLASASHFSNSIHPPFDPYSDENGNPSSACTSAINDEESLDPDLFDIDVDTRNTENSVPVYDQAVVEALDEIGEWLETQLVDNLLISVEYEQRLTTRYLTQLCQKEYEDDHQLQHAWRKVIDEFVFNTHEFVTSGNGGTNPMFLKSPAVYFQLVDDNVLLTLASEIAISDIGDDTKRFVIKSLIVDRFENKFPYNVGGADTDTPTLAPDNLQEDLRANYINAGGLEALQTYGEPRFTSSGVLDMARDELQRRKNEQARIEEMKLDWGRGFFSYEYCNYGDGNADGVGQLGLFTDIRTDRRNCYVVTPGSLIQDEVSLIFGSAIRQMELADEYEEWVGAQSIAVLGSVVGTLGLDYPVFGTTAGDAAYDSRIYRTENLSSPIDPPTARAQIEDLFFGGESFYTGLPGGAPHPYDPDLQNTLTPSEHSNQYIDPQSSTQIDRNTNLAGRLDEVLRSIETVAPSI